MIWSSFAGINLIIWLEDRLQPNIELTFERAPHTHDFTDSIGQISRNLQTARRSVSR